MAIWLVRAGGRGEQQHFALENSAAVFGWFSEHDLSRFTAKEEMRAFLEKVCPDWSKSRISNALGQAWAFTRRIQKNDLIALPLKDQDAIAFARVTGDYVYRRQNPEGARHIRPVEWITQDLPRSRLDQDILYSLGAFMTVCQISRHNAEQRIRATLNGSAAPPPLSKDDDSEIEASDETAAQNVEENAATQIRGYISQKFTGHKLADLIEAILVVQGYQTEKSPPGPDGGVDINAGRGPPGFDPPRLCVQVKSGDAQQDIKVLRELKGVMKDMNAEQGLFVSWSGFKRTVITESKRQYFEIRLWDAKDVIAAIQKHYDNFPDTIKAELPLKRVWTLVHEDEE